MKLANLKKWHFWIKPLIIVVGLLFIHSTTDHAFWHFGKHDFWVNPNYKSQLELVLPNTIDYTTGSGGGGLAGKGIASPAPGLIVNDLTLVYDTTKADGERLQISINGGPVSHRLFDWLLIPIANFADSDVHGMVSLFGPQTDSVKYDISFHEAFENTLLGIRLLHSDIFFIDLNEFWKVPDYDGEVIIANEERIPVGDTHWYNPAVQLSNVFANEETFQSWIKIDLGTEYTFDLVNSQLSLEGLPFYFFWKADWEGYIEHFNVLAAKADSALMAGNITLYNTFVDSANNLQPDVIEVETLTQGMKNAYHYIEAYNPYAYDATLATYQYAAFFRYVKINFPNSWNNFISSIQAIQIEPQVSTPTVWWYNGEPEIFTHIKKRKLEPNVLGVLEIYPNPTNGPLTFSLNNRYAGQIKITVYNASGIQMLQNYTPVSSANYVGKLDISDYPAGMYFIQASVGRYVSVGKILKQ